MTFVPIRLPLLGLNDNEAYGSQPEGTSRRLLNVRAIDPTDGTRRIAQRSGLAKYNAAQVSGANKIKHVAVVATDRAKVTHTSLGNSPTVETAVATPAVDAVLNTRTDRQGNVYALNGRVGVVKYNPTMTKLWTLNLPTTDTAHVCRALFVDDQDLVFVGVSAGGQQATAKMWCYAQEPDNKTRLLWELTLAAYVEEIKVKAGKLYTLQNRPDRGASEVVVYENYTVPTPTETQRFSTCAPANGMDPGIDGSVFVCGEPTATRGLDPLAPDASPKAQDWVPTMLSQWGTRAWAWVASDSADDFIITNIANAPDEDGGSITTWLDKTGNGRHLYGAGSLSIASRANPTYRARGSSGRPSVFFNGTTSKMISLGNANTTDQFQQQSFLPGYTGAMYCIVGIGKMTEGTTDRRWVFGIQTAAGSQKLFINVDAGAAFPAAADTGSMAWYESQATTNASGVGTKPNNYPFTSLHPWNRTASSGARNLPNGWFIFAIAFTNGQSGITDSWCRINGNPVDVWTSTADTWTDGFQLGEVTTVSTGTTKDPSGSYSFFPGEIMEMIVLRDYRTSGGVLSLVEVNGTAGSIYPDANFAGIPNVENTEIQKLEGYLGHKWGAAHVLPAGTAARLQFALQVANNETVTVGTTMYRFRDVNNVLGGGAQAFTQANDILIGANVQATCLNFIKTINLSGTAGTTYQAATALNASMYAFPQRFNEDADATPAAMLRSIAQDSATIATTETMAGAGNAFTAATAQTSLAPDAAGENTGFYPHPFALSRVTNGTAQIISTGGPPRQADADYAGPSKASLVNSVYGVLVKHADSGRPRWVATSGYSISTTPVGGVGYGVAVNSVGDVYSCGPRQAAIGAGSADNIDVRKIIDLGDSFSIATGTTATTAWQDDQGALTYHYPRMAVDKYDNVFVPYSLAGTSMIAYAKLGVALVGSDNADEIVVLTTLTDDPVGYSVAVDPNYPDYQTTFTNTRPEFIFLGTEKASTGNLALHRLKLVGTASRTGTPRSLKYVAVAQGDIKTFTSAAIATPTGGAGALDTAAQYVCSALINRKLIFTDGVSYKVYDIDADTVTTFAATSAGTMPKGAALMCVWRNRLVIAKRPSNWYMSAVDAPDNWDFFPPNAPIATMAIAGNNSIPGRPSDIINSLMPFDRARLVIGGDHSLRMIEGDPAAGGQILHISETVGSGFGQSQFCKDPGGALYFWENKGGVIRFDGSGIRSLTDGRIERRMRDIDFSLFYMALVWDSRRFGLHVFQMPFADHTGTIKAWFWDAKSDAWFEDEYSGNPRPTAATVIDGDLAADRVLILGSQDGYLRSYSDTALTDDGTKIDARCLLGPFVQEGSGFNFRTRQLHAVLGATQAGCRYQAYMSDTAEQTGLMVREGLLDSGRNIVPMRLRGSALWVELRNVSQVVGTNTGSRFAIDSVGVEMSRAGRVNAS